jgi:hypothetical protein
VLTLTGTCSESAAWDKGGRAPAPSTPPTLPVPPTSGTAFAYDDDDSDDEEEVSAAWLVTDVAPKLLLLPPPDPASGLDFLCKDRKPRKFDFLGLGDSAGESLAPALSMVGEGEESVGELGQESLAGCGVSPASSCKGVGTDWHRSCLVSSPPPPREPFLP